MHSMQEQVRERVWNNALDWVREQVWVQTGEVLGPTSYRPMGHLVDVVLGQIWKQCHATNSIS